MRHDTGSDTPENELPMSDVASSDQAQLGQWLREKRDELGIGLDEIVRTTKIPRASLLNIEAGEFDRLPGDVFARGFLRSYARCVHLDGDEVVQRYAQCGLAPAPVSSRMAKSVLADSRLTERRKDKRHARGSTESSPESVAEPDVTVDVQATKGSAVRKVLRDAFDLGRGRRTARPSQEDKSSSDPSPKSSSNTTPKRVRTFLPPSFDSQDDMTHRGPLTLGVIILVIVATLTMSYLLRRPGTSTDGFTKNIESSVWQTHA